MLNLKNTTKEELIAVYAYALKCDPQVNEEQFNTLVDAASAATKTMLYGTLSARAEWDMDLAEAFKRWPANKSKITGALDEEEEEQPASEPEQNTPEEQPAPEAEQTAPAAVPAAKLEKALFCTAVEDWIENYRTNNPESKVEVKTWEKLPAFYSIKIDGTLYFEVHASRNGVRPDTKSKYIPEDKRPAGCRIIKNGLDLYTPSQADLTILDTYAACIKQALAEAKEAKEKAKAEAKSKAKQEAAKARAEQTGNAAK